LLGIRKINGLQIDLFVGDFQEFLCDSWICLLDYPDQLPPLECSSGVVTANAFPFELRNSFGTYDTKNLSCRSGLFFTLDKTQLTENDSVFGDIGEICQSLKIGHLGLCVSHKTTNQALLGEILFAKLLIKAESLRLNRLTVILELATQYKIWQEALWKVIPEETE